MALPLENIDIETVTLGKLAQIYTREQELKTPLSLGSLLKKYENTPAIDVFKEEGGVPSIAKQVMRNAQAEGASDSVQKSALKTLRYLSNRIYNAYPSDPPAFLVPNEKNNPKSAIEFFGIKEPAKAVSMLQVSTDEEVIGDFVKQLIQYGYKNPEKMPHVRAIMFGMNTGLRPNASLGVKVKEYNPEKGALYIPATETGAKGRAISIPLSNMADAMLQQQVKSLGKFFKNEQSPLFVDTKGNPLKTTDVNAVLEEIIVPGIVFDESTGQYYDSLKPKGESGSKFGMSLFRNYHATRGEELRISDGILGKLEGRSLNSVGKDPGTGELYTYRSRFPFRVSEYERGEANKFASDFETYVAEAVEEIQQEDPDFTFDRGSAQDLDQTRAVEFLDSSGANYFGRVQVDSPKRVEAPPEELKVSEGKGGPVDYSGIPQDILEALDSINESTQKVAQLGRPKKPKEDSPESPSVLQALELFDVALETTSTKPPPPESEQQTPPSFRKLAKNLRNVARAGRTIGGAYMLRKAIQENLKPSEEGQPATLFDLGYGLVNQVEDLFNSSSPKKIQPTTDDQSMNPLYQKDQGDKQ
jgi:hypothetical protein